MGKVTFLILLFLLFVNKIQAVPASPEIFTTVQPDGSVVKIRLRGDEWFNYTETIDGYTIIFDDTLKTWFYAELSKNGELVKSKISASFAPPKTLQKKLLPKKEKMQKMKSKQSHSSFFYPNPKLTEQKLLVILVDFLDRSPIGNIYLAGSTEKVWDEHFFGDVNSVKKYYKEVSNNKFTFIPAEENSGIINNGIVDWITLPYNHPNSGSNFNDTIAQDAIKASDEFVDFSQFDTNFDGWLGENELSIIIIVAGYESSGSEGKRPGVWAHAWTFWDEDVPVLDGVRICESFEKPQDKRENWYAMVGEWDNNNGITPIGVFAHELGHVLFLPDLYDTDFSSKGVGEWCLMGYGSWNGINKRGDTPSQISAWCKIRLGWLNPEIVQDTVYDKILYPVEDSAKCIKIWEDAYKNNRFFLLEYREKKGFDAALPGNGLLIWHINEDEFENNNDLSRLVDLEEADGLNALDKNTNSGDSGDFYPGFSNNTIFDKNSNPNSNDYFGDTTKIEVNNIKLNSNGTISMDILPRYANGYTQSYCEFGTNDYWNGNFKSILIKLISDSDGKFEKLKAYFYQDNINYTANIYSSFDNYIPSQLVYSKSGKINNKGWNLIIFDTTINVILGQELFLELIIDNFKAPIDYYGTSSGQSYYNINGTYLISNYDFDIRAMFSYNPFPPKSGFNPENNGRINILYPKISWDYAPDTNFTFIIRLDDDGEIENNYKFEYEIFNSTYINLPKPLTDKIKWCYAICIKDTAGEISEWSELQNFEVDTDETPPVPFSLIFPIKAEEANFTSQFKWNESKDKDPQRTVTYDIYIDNNASFLSPDIVKLNISGNNFYLQDSTLSDHTLYYWKVKASDNYKFSTWSDTTTFMVNYQNEIPSKPQLIKPSSNKIFNFEDSTLIFQWVNSTDPDPYDTTLTYSILISENNNFDQNNIEIKNLYQNYYLLKTLEKSGTFFSKIIAFDEHGSSSESEIRKFTIKPQVEKIVLSDKKSKKNCFLTLVSKYSITGFYKMIKFRDRYLLNNKIGKNFTKIYYLITR